MVCGEVWELWDAAERMRCCCRPAVCKCVCRTQKLRLLMLEL